ncbi:MAG: hypothetical protein AB7F75_00010 [Planctomycetota bacterium]
MKPWLPMVLLLGMSGLQGTVEEPSGDTRDLPAIQVQADGGLAFAQALEKEGDLYRSITEYKRVVHLREDGGSVRKAWLGVCRCYARGRKWPALEAATQQAMAEPEWDKSADRQLKLMRALALWNLQRFTEARDVLKDMEPEALGNDGRLLMAWVSLACGDTEAAREQFCQTEYPPVDPFELEALHAEGQKPWLAGTLSAILPGAGQLYAGKPQAAAGAFVVNAILIGATIESFDEDHEILGAGLGILALGFYVGNIYGAVNYVSQENEMIKKQPDAWIAKKNGMHESFRETLDLNFIYKF